MPITLRNMKALVRGEVNVDLEKSTIDGISIIQKGEALGHGFVVDDVMLQQVADAINATPKGVRSRLTHPGMPDCGGWDGVETLLGRVSDAQVVGDKVRGKLTMGRYASSTPAGDLRKYVMAVADEDPEFLGLSIVFDPAPFADAPKGADKDPAWPKGGEDGDEPLPMGRVASVGAADVVGDPAANRDGLLARVTPIFQKKLSAGDVARWLEYLTDSTGAQPSPAPLQKGHLPMNKKLLAVLVGLGLSSNATPEVAQRFLESLSADKQEWAKKEAEKKDAGVQLDAGGMKYCSECGASIAGDSKYCSSCGHATGPVGALARVAPARVEELKTPEQLAAEQEKARRAELKEIAQLGKLPEEKLNSWILNKTSVEDARKEACETLAAANTDVPVISVGENRQTLGLGEAIADAIMLRQGFPLVSWETDALGNRRVAVNQLANGKIEPKVRQPHARTREFMGKSLMEMAMDCMRLSGVDTNGLARPELARLAFNPYAMARRGGNIRLFEATADFGNLLADMQNKILGTAYQLAPDTTYWCRMRPIKDFKQASTTKLSAAPALVQVAAGAEYGFYSFGDTGEKYTLAKYGYIIGFNWETLINDDLNGLVTAPQSIGLACKALKVDLVYSVLTGNPAMSDTYNLFDSTHHGNSFTGALSIQAWNNIKAGMAKQKSNGQILNSAPKYLIIPVELETAAANIILPNALLQVSGGSATTQQNPYAGKVEVVSEPRLSIDSAVKHYAAADPGLMDTIEIGYLEGEPEPVVTQEEGFNFDGRKMKVRYTVATKAADYRGLAYSTGA